jgi:hypothetical protein
MLLLLVIVMLMIILGALAGDHAPDKAPKINREGTWCDNGSQTSTTGECICSTHLGYHCAGGIAADTNSASATDVSKICQSGYGISFFHHSCLTCRCELSAEWQERKQAFRSNMKENPPKGGRKGKRKSKDAPDGEESVLVKETF